MAEVRSLRTHLITELRDLLDAERQLTKVLPDFASRAATPALRAAFEHHLEETHRHISRLQQAFGILGKPAQAKRCEGMQGLVREGNSVVSGARQGALRDAVMITAAQKVEHYEMASYGTARTYATVLGEPRVAALLEATLQEEKTADAKLTEIAEGKVNEKAAEEWHQAATGVLEQTAYLAGKAVGIGARTVQRASNVIGLGRKRRQDVTSGRLMERTASSVTGAVTAAAHMAGDVAASARAGARRRMKPPRKASAARKVARKRSSGSRTHIQSSKKR